MSAMSDMIDPAGLVRGDVIDSLMEATEGQAELLRVQMSRRYGLAGGRVAVFMVNPKVLRALLTEVRSRRLADARDALATSFVDSSKWTGRQS